MKKDVGSAGGKSRNNALHGMAKIADGDKDEWDDKIIADAKKLLLKENYSGRRYFRVTNSR